MSGQPTRDDLARVDAIEHYAQLARETRDLLDDTDSPVVWLRASLYANMRILERARDAELYDPQPIGLSQ